MLGDSVRRRQPKRRASGAGKPGRSSGGGAGRWKHLLWAVPAALVVPFIIGYLLAVYVVFPPEEASGAGVPVPDLVGRTLVDAHAEMAIAGLGALEVTELPHPSAAPGVVVAQSPLAGQQLRPSAGARIAVSRGRPQVLVPDVQGFAADRAEEMLRRAGFDVVVASEEDAAPAGRVLRTDPVAGQERVLPAAVTLVVSAGPPPMAEPDTLPDFPTPPPEPDNGFPPADDR
ncbi:MAG TPA: PASTA domain-containing protein [Longimicrobiales bacterium]|nr:PASTA domain-containing protein [Longimicrobiales bacterium]